MRVLNAAVPLGIGDTWWVLQKLEALQDYYGAKITLHVNQSANHDSVEFLKLFPFVHDAVRSDAGIYDIAELVPWFEDHKWSEFARLNEVTQLTRLRTSRFADMQLILQANGHLHNRQHLDSWLHPLPTRYLVPELHIPEADARRVRADLPLEPVLVYCSGIGPNKGFHDDTWSPQHWATVIALLVEAGAPVVLVGAPTADDLGQVERVTSLLHDSVLRTVVNYVGKTSVAGYMYAIQNAAAWVGLNSGGGIMSASFRTPTVMLWSDDRYPIGRIKPLVAEMQNSWLRDTTRYRTLSFGSPALQPHTVVRTVLGLLQ